MKQAALSMRPGTIITYEERRWRVIENNTLENYFIMETISGHPHLPHRRKRFRYQPGAEIAVTWIPFETRN